MSIDGWAYLPDNDESYPCTLYLPGEPMDLIDGMNTGCAACGYLLGETEDVTTGQMVYRAPGSGDHDGLVGWHYAPAPGYASMRDADVWHLRCVTDSAGMGSIVLTIGTEAASAGRGRHAA